MKFLLDVNASSAVKDKLTLEGHDFKLVSDEDDLLKSYLLTLAPHFF